MIFRPAHRPPDFDRFAVLAEHHTVKMPDHLMHFRADDHHVSFSDPFKEGREGQVNPLRFRGAQLPGGFEVLGGITKDHVLAELNQAPINAESVLGGTGVVRPSCSKVAAERAAVRQAGGETRPIPKTLIGPYSPTKIERGEAVFGGEGDFVPAQQDPTGSRQGVVFCRELEQALAPRHHHIQAFVHFGLGNTQIRLERFALKIRDVHQYPDAAGNVFHTDAATLNRETRVIANMIPEAHIPAEGSDDSFLDELARREVEKIDERQTGIVHIAQRDREKVGRTGDTPVIPAFLAQGMPEKLAILQGLARPAYCLWVQFSVWKAKVNSLGEFSFRQHGSSFLVSKTNAFY